MLFLVWVNYPKKGRSSAHKAALGLIENDSQAGAIADVVKRAKFWDPGIKLTDITVSPVGEFIQHDFSDP